MAVLLFEQWDYESRKWLEKATTGPIDEMEALAKLTCSRRDILVRFVRVTTRHPSLER